MTEHQRICPISLYIGRFFEIKRIALKYDLKEVAKELSVSIQYLKNFENGNLVIDALFLIKLEKFYQLSYKEYKPPVSYYGFLGLEADESNLLRRTKTSIRNLKKNFIRKESKRKLENALLKLRYSNKKGKRNETFNSSEGDHF